MKDVKSSLYRFDQIEIDVQNLRVTVGSEIRPLEPKSFRLLVFLLENPRCALAKDEIMTAVWGETFVSDNSLARAITSIRKALDDDPKAPRFIETVPSVGYRFVGEVSQDSETQAVQPDASPEPARAEPLAPSHRRRWPRVAAVAGVLLLVNAGMWFLKLRTAPLPPQKLVPVTTYAGSEEYPSFSPDGRQVAFYWNGEKGVNPGIYVKLLGEPNALRLTSGPDAFPVWSPDGTRIAFVRGLEPGGAPVGNAIYTVSALGGPERKIVDIEVSGQMSWSPDGKWLALAKGRAFDSAIYVLSPDGGEPRRIPNPKFRQFDNAPAFSRDGHRLAFAGCSGRYSCDIFLQNLGRDATPEGTPRQITHHEATPRTIGIYGLTWARDGRSLAYSGRQDFGAISYLWRAAADGSQSPQRLEMAGPAASFPSASPVSDRLVFKKSLEDHDIWRFRSDGGLEPLIVSSLLEYAPQYSPDGTKIVFGSNRAGDGNEIWVTQADGSRPVQVTRGPGVNQGTPRWSPDGRWIAFDSYSRNSPPGIFVIEASGSSPRSITPNGNSPFWSPDGKWIYFNDKKQIWRIPFASGPVEQVTKHGGGSTAYVSGDGKTLFFMKASVGPVYALPLSGAEKDSADERQIIPYAYYKEFFPTKDGIYYVGALGDDGLYPLELYQFPDGKTRLLGKISGSLNQGLTVSPDGKSILLTRSPNTGSDIMMIENF